MRGVNSDSIDLIYLDPPFNKKKVFSAPVDSSVDKAEFSDVFQREDIEDEWLDIIKRDQEAIYALLNTARVIEGRTSHNYCYLAYMAIRLIEMRRILKDTGSIYLHCDPTMSHYLKLLMDCIFGDKNFRNEIIWGYSGGSNLKNAFLRKHDIILFYAKGRNVFNRDDVRVPFASNTRIVNGRYGVYVRDARGKKCLDWWGDIPSFSTSTQAKERVGYPTQKPLALLSRIIKASSSEGDLILDPFCGCATTCVAAEKLGRQWVGIDVSMAACEFAKIRFERLGCREVCFRTSSSSRVDSEYRE